MPKLKDRILRSAWTLFEERGYEKVSLRAIAEHAGTTIGNLTYHYPQKEDLLVAMQLSNQGETLTQFGTMADTPEGVLRELWLMAEATVSRGREKAFNVGHILRLCGELPSLRANVGATRERVRALYRSRFRFLRERGCMRSDLSEDVYDDLMRALVLSVYSWLEVRRAFGDAECRASMARIMKNLFRLCLTEKGQALLESMERERGGGGPGA